MSGDTFNFSNTQTGAGSVAQQAYTISGDAVTTVSQQAEAANQLRNFFSAATALAGTVAAADAVPAPAVEDVSQVIPQAVAQVAESSPELMVDTTAEPDALPLSFVMSELGTQANLPAAERDVPLIKQMLRVVHANPAEVLRIVGRVSLAFGRGWLTSMVSNNPVFAATLAAINTAEALVNKDQTPT